MKVTSSFKSLRNRAKSLILVSLLLGTSISTLANPLPVVRALEMVLSRTTMVVTERGGVTAASLLPKLYGLAASNTLPGFELTNAELTQLEQIGNLGDEAALGNVFKDPSRAKQFLNSVKAALYTHNLILGADQASLKNALVAEKETKNIIGRFDATFAQSSAAPDRGQIVFNHKFTAELGSLLRRVPKRIRDIVMTQSKALYAKFGNLAGGQYRNIAKGVAKTRAEITKSLNIKFPGAEISYWSIMNNGACEVVSNLKNLWQVDKVFYDMIDQIRSLSDIPTYYRAAFAQVITHGNKDLAVSIIKDKQITPVCRDVAPNIAGVFL